MPMGDGDEDGGGTDCVAGNAGDAGDGELVLRLSMVGGSRMALQMMAHSVMVLRMMMMRVMMLLLMMMVMVVMMMSALVMMGKLMALRRRWPRRLSEPWVMLLFQLLCPACSCCHPRDRQRH